MTQVNRPPSPTIDTRSAISDPAAYDAGVRYAEGLHASIPMSRGADVARGAIAEHALVIATDEGFVSLVQFLARVLRSVRRVTGVTHAPGSGAFNQGGMRQ